MSPFDLLSELVDSPPPFGTYETAIVRRLLLQAVRPASNVVSELLSAEMDAIASDFDLLVGSQAISGGPFASGLQDQLRRRLSHLEGIVRRASNR